MPPMMVEEQSDSNKVALKTPDVVACRRGDQADSFLEIFTDWIELKSNVKDKEGISWIWLWIQ